MVSISKFYNNVKSFILQSFESKSKEDYNLPNQVESLFVYNNGKDYVKETTIPTPVAGDGGGQIYQSTYVLDSSSNGTILNMDFSNVHSNQQITYSGTHTLSEYSNKSISNQMLLILYLFNVDDTIIIKINPTYVNNNYYTGFHIKCVWNGSNWNITDMGDYLWYDFCNIDNTNDYEIVDATNFIQDSGHYELIRTATSNTANYHTYIYPKDIRLPQNYEIRADLLGDSANTTNNINFGIKVGASLDYDSYTNGIELFGYSTTKGLAYRTLTTFNGDWRTNGNLSHNTWYRFILTVIGTSITGKIINLHTNDVVYENTVTYTPVKDFHLPMLCIGDNVSNMYIKNFNIKKNIEV